MDRQNMIQLLKFCILKNKCLSAVLRNAADMIEDNELEQHPTRTDQLYGVFEKLCRIEEEKIIKKMAKLFKNNTDRSL